MSTIKKAVALTALLSTALADPKVVEMSMERRPSTQRLSKRDDVANVTISNAIFDGLYFVNATVGEPPQLVQLQLDTGSSDIWFFGPRSCDSRTSRCLGGIYDPSDSDTVQIIAKGEFFIRYGTPGSRVEGDYIRDSLSVANITVNNLTMAYATRARYVTTGIMGIGFPENEAIVAQGGDQYKNIIDLMVEQDLINTRAYSLYLNDLDSKHGTILFGGYDRARFTGALRTLPMQPDSDGVIRTMTVAWTSLAVTDDGDTTRLTSDRFAEPALLDSGSTLSLIPDELFEAIVDRFDVITDDEGNGLVECDTLEDEDITLDFGFGGEDGFIIRAPLRQFSLPVWDLTGQPLELANGDRVCQLGLMPQSALGLPIILGDTFLRGAYVVYDLDNHQISMAQAVYNATGSEIVEITEDNQIGEGPVITGVSVTQTATGAPAPGFEPTSSGTVSESDEDDDEDAGIPSAQVPGLLKSVGVTGLSMLAGMALFALR